MANEQFDGKVAIVTGGASGIGAACSTTLAQGGAKVVVADLNEELGKEIVSQSKRQRCDLYPNRCGAAPSG